jgi:hypothetical protein
MRTTRQVSRSTAIPPAQAATAEAAYSESVLSAALRAVDSFWASPDESLHTEEVIAAVLVCSEAKLQNDRWRGRGLPFYRMPGGRGIRYRKSDVLAALGEPVRSTTEADARAAEAA